MKIFLSFILVLSTVIFTSCSSYAPKNTSSGIAGIAGPESQIAKDYSEERNVQHGQAQAVAGAVEGKGAKEGFALMMPQSSPPASASPAAIKQPIERKIIRNGDFLIESKNLAEDQRKIAALAESLGGFVVTSEFKQSTSGSSESTVKIIVRVPSSQFDKAITEIAKTGSQVIYDKKTGQDVTEEFVDLEARLRAKHALENQYLEIMKRAAKISDVLEVQEKLTEVRTEIEQMEGRRRYLENQASMSTINVTLQSPAAVVAATQNGFWRSIKNSFGDGVDEAVGIVLGIIHFVLVMLPIFLLLILPGWFLLRFLNRRYNFLKRWKKEIVSVQEQE